MELIKLPTHDPTDIPARLRSLAEAIEGGEYGDAHNLGWVIDCGSGRIEVGMLGQAGVIGPELFLLLSIGAHKIVRGCIAG